MAAASNTVTIIIIVVVIAVVIALAVGIYYLVKWLEGLKPLPSCNKVISESRPKLMEN
jgi:uncharacterized membrane protein